VSYDRRVENEAKGFEGGCMRFLFWLYMLILPGFKWLEYRVLTEIRKRKIAEVRADAEIRLERFRRETKPGILRKYARAVPGECTHLKGGTRPGHTGPIWRHKDFNVSWHTFVDGHSEIRCLICGEKWLPDDPVRWAEGMRMVESSSNSRSSNEVHLGKFEDMIVLDKSENRV
jgi:hypothetical protein